jgi:4-alpha-glucanotransferase
MVDYGPVINWKLTVLDRAHERFLSNPEHPLQFDFNQFQHSEKAWLDDFALFMAIKEAQGGKSWDNWPNGLRSRDITALEEFRQHNPGAVEKHAFRQFLFFRQWAGVKEYANDKGIQIMGDIPIFVAYDSADAWGHPNLFYFNRKGKPTVVAGVPPDYFSATGQLWGNPLYRWNIHAKNGYDWWIARVKAVLKLVDIIRLDHFRGFAGYWEVPAGMPTAEKGRWVPGPGAALFSTLKKVLGDLPIIAEDLGEITPDVIVLRDEFGLPGMRILQFAFAKDAKDLFLPHNYVVNCVAYTGTHDNETSCGWFEQAPKKERDFCRRYLARSGEDIAWDMIRAVWSSVAASTLAPLQDFLSLGSSARMNYPGRASGNWSWRVPVEAIDEVLRDRIFELNWLYGRLPPKEAKEEE